MEAWQVRRPEPDDLTVRQSSKDGDAIKPTTTTKLAILPIEPQPQKRRNAPMCPIYLAVD